MNENPIKSGSANLASPSTKIILNPYEQIADYRCGVFNFSFPATLQWMEERGKILFGNHFSIYPDDLELIYKLLVYAIGDKENAERHGISLWKGILLVGPIGSGKTSLLKLVNYFFPRETQYEIKPTREISFEFEKDGFAVINRYSKGSFFRYANMPFIPKVYCFDDLGLEQTPKYYGNECNVMAEILLNRYDLFVSKRMMTHITTNLSASELESIYGNRIRSRMREMFNLVAFDRDTKDKRV
jgi:energy-coupling factor transporter ATP-binding protein EcfA2